MAYVESCLENESRTYNSVQLSRKLKEERRVNLSSDRLRDLLKKNYRWKRTRHGFEYALVEGGFKRDGYIEVMNWVAQKASRTMAETGKITVVVQDNGFIHKSKITQAQWSVWAEQGLIMFFLPPYCSEMNPIEGEWHQLKAHEMEGRRFSSSRELTIAVESGVENRYHPKNYKVERFIFNSA
jgi:putative transposase